jgi:hypothetical protein
MFKANHESELIKVLHHRKLVERLAPKYEESEEEVRARLQEAQKLDPDQWELMHWPYRDQPDVTDEMIQLDEMNAESLGKPELAGKWQFEYEFFEMDEFAVIVVCEDEDGEDVLSTALMVGGNIVPL